MTDSVLKPAEFRPATNYDTNPYYDENFDHSVVDPLKQIDGRLDALETTVDAAETGLSDRVEALETTVDTDSTGLSDRVAAIEADLFTEETGLSDRVEALETTVGTISGPFLFSIIQPEVENGPMTLDKTYAEFEEALLAGKPIYLHMIDGVNEGYSPSFYSMEYNPSWDAPYAVVVFNNSVPVGFVSTTKNGTLTAAQTN